MILTARDEQRLVGVHPHLIRVIRRAAKDTTLNFTILEGVRTVARQRQLVAQRASKTMNSRHIPGVDGFAKAVDIAPLLDLDDDGKIETAEMFAWPLYPRLAKIIKAAAAAEGVPIEWGGDWRTFKDGPHWQLPHKVYP